MMERAADGKIELDLRKDKLVIGIFLSFMALLLIFFGAILIGFVVLIPGLGFILWKILETRRKKP